MRRNALACLVVSLILIGLAARAGAARYKVIPMDGGSEKEWWQGISINSNCQLAGVIYTVNGPRGFVWSGGNMTVIGTLGGNFAWFHGINSLGDAIGESDTSDGYIHVFLWKGGRKVDLGKALPEGWDSSGVAINDAGKVVATAYYPPTAYWCAVLIDSMLVTELESLGGGETEATAMNNRDEIVGSSRTSDGEVHATLWRGSEVVDLGTLGGWYSGATAISDHGWVTSTSYTSAMEPHAFVWHDGRISDITPRGMTASGEGINTLGQVVGTCMPEADSPATSYPFIWEKDRGMANLNDLIDPSAGWKVRYATHINDHGWITASAERADGSYTHAGVILAPLGKPRNTGLSPALGTIRSGGQYTFRTVYSDPDGCRDLRYCYFVISQGGSLKNAIYAIYDQSRNKLYLRKIDDSGWVGGHSPGESVGIDTETCKLYCKGTTVERGKYDLTITWSIRLKRALAGDSFDAWMFDRDYLDLRGGWDRKGTFRITR